MDLSSHYLGLELANPFVPSSTPLSKNLDSARQLEDAGAGALIMHSLFQEEIEVNQGADMGSVAGGDLLGGAHNMNTREPAKQTRFIVTCETRPTPSRDTRPQSLYCQTFAMYSAAMADPIRKAGTLGDG